MAGLVSTAEEVSVVLSSIIEMIARDDFDLNWPNLMDQFTEGLNSEEPQTTMRILRTADTILKKIRFSY